MNIFEMLDREAKPRGLAFLIIGGHAVNAYGYSRFTEDVDILVNRDQRDDWLAVIGKCGWKVFHDGGTFLQFEATERKFPRLDLMLVNGPTFSKLQAGMREYIIGEQKFFVPSLDDIFALKFHVLKQKVPGRGYKDLLDIITLADVNGIDVCGERMKAICDKFGSPAIYEKIIAFNS